MADEVSDIVAAVERALVEPQTRSSARG
jgi:hypothetical protein